MFTQIDKLKKSLDKQRPFNPELMATIAQKFREDWTYNTNAIEGNTMTLQETAFFLREGLTVKGRTLKEHLEMINHAEAVIFLQDTIKCRNLSEGLIKELHAMLFSGMDRDKSVVPGVCKIKDNHVLTASGKVHYYAPAIQVPDEMERLLTWYNNSKPNIHPIELSALFHHRFVAIHPFTDGNGRVGRLCMNYILMQNGYPPAIIRKENRLEYYMALEEADNNKPEVFIKLIADEVKRSLKLMVKEIKRFAKQRQHFQITQNHLS